MESKISKRFKWLVIGGFILISIVILITGYYYFKKEEATITANSHQELKAIADLKTREILSWKTERIGDALVISKNPELILATQQLLAGQASDYAELYLQKTFETFKQAYEYLDLLIVDTGGQVLFSTRDEVSQLNIIEKADLDESIASKKPVFGDMEKCMDCDEIHLDIYAPIMDDSGTVIGGVILQEDPSNYLFPLIQTWPTTSQSAETLLVRKDGDFALYINELRHRQGTALKIQIPLTQSKVPAVMAIQGKTGYMEGIDYRGIPVIADARQISGTSWFMIAKVDRDEILADLKYRTGVISIFVTLSIILVATISAYFYNLRQRRLLANLVSAENAKNETNQLFRATLYSIGDAVITTDNQGKVNQLNRVAEDLTGWTEEEAQGKPLAEVFHIINEASRVEVENPVIRVLNEGIIIGLANHTVLISKTGQEYQIADSGAPIRNAANEIIGVVLVFRDLTEEYKLRGQVRLNEERYSLLFSNMSQGFSLHEIILDEDGNPCDYRFLDVNPAFEQLTGLVKADILGKTVKEILPEIEDEWIQNYGKVALTGESITFLNYSQDLNKTYETRVFCPRRGQFAVLFTDITEMIEEKKRIQDSETSFKNRSEELEMLFRISIRLREAQNINEALPIILGELCSILKSDAGEVILMNRNKEQFSIAIANGFLSSAEGKIFNINDGVAGEVLRTMQPVNLIDYLENPHHIVTSPEAIDIGPAMMAPMQSKSDLLGVLFVARKRGEGVQPFTDNDLHILSAISEIAGNAVHRMSLFEESQLHLKQTQALHSIDIAISGSLDLTAVLNVVLEQTMDQLNTDAASILIFQPKLLRFDIAAAKGFRAGLFEPGPIRLGEALASKAALEQQTLMYPNINDAPERVSRNPLILREGFKAYYAAPIIAKGSVIGVLEVFHRSTLNVNNEWLEYLETIAGQASLAIDNLNMFSDLQRSNLKLRMAYDATIEGWSRALDLRDKETEGHSQRVTEMTVELARMMDIRDDQIESVRMGALLHDIGKLGVPDSILLKPGPLTPDEREVIERHPRLAVEMLSSIEYLHDSLDIPHYHHEKWDGTGYPNGLKQDRIPLSARIFAVADVWDALTSDRPYRNAWSQDKAMEYIREQSGTHFDPKIVDAFLKIVKTDK